MKRIIFLAVISALMILPASAQTTPAAIVLATTATSPNVPFAIGTLSVGEAAPVSKTSDNNIFIGGSFTHNGDLPTKVKGVPGFLKSGNNIGGADLGFSGKVAGPFGLALDLNYSHKPGDTQVTFAGGPEFTIRGKANQVFLHALIGGAHQEQTSKVKFAALADSSFAYFLGGGYRHFFTKHVGIQTGVDYFYTEAFHSSEQNLRATAGIAFRL